jgi:flagellin-like hook-associated protein FlgL
MRQAGEARRSKIEDTNMAEAITRLTKAETAYRAALGSVSPG